MKNKIFGTQTTLGARSLILNKKFKVFFNFGIILDIVVRQKIKKVKIEFRNSIKNYKK